MTSDQLLAKTYKIKTETIRFYDRESGVEVQRLLEFRQALRAVIKLHIGDGISNRCASCSQGNSCETIKVIEKALR
jgi:hypothetical protein